MNINSKFKWKSGSYFSSWASDWLPRIEKCTFNLFIKRGKLNNSEQQYRKHSSYITDHPLKNSLCWQTTESSTSTEMSDVEDEDLLPELSTWHTGKRLNDHSQIPKAALSHCYITHTHTLMQGWCEDAATLPSSALARSDLTAPPTLISTLLLEFPSWSMVTLSPCLCVCVCILLSSFICVARSGWWG